MGALIKDFLSHKLRPLLRQRGYVKKGNSFLRESGEMIYIINIQGSSLFSWKGKETFYVNVGIVSTRVERAVGHSCSIKETSPSDLLFSQVHLRADQLLPLENSEYTIDTIDPFDITDKCLKDIVQVDGRFCQIKYIEDLYDLLFKSLGSQSRWKPTYMRYWAMTGEWKRFDLFYEMTSRFCKANRIKTSLMKELESLCKEYGHEPVAISNQYGIREIRSEEIPLLNDFLYEAIFIPEGVPAPPKSIIENENLQVYVQDFGKKPDDRCLVAEVDGKIVGAVWTRIMDDYGHVADGIPSLAISLYKDYRHQGIGTRLLQEMLQLLRRDGYPKVSLSVQKANYAFKMYRKAAFEVLKETEEEYLMLCKLKKQ